MSCFDQKTHLLHIVLVYTSQVALGSVADSNFWAERRKSMAKEEGKDRPLNWHLFPSNLVPLRILLRIY